MLALALSGCTANQSPNGIEGATAMQPEEVSSLARSNADFAVALFRQLSTKPGNLVISPISIVRAMAPVAAGAQGETRTAIDRTMRFSPGSARAAGALLRDLASKRDGAQVNIANALWVQQGFALKPPFLAVAKGDFGASVESLDFNQPTVAAGRINDWVSRATAKRIPTLVEASSLNSYTALVVTNAVYLLADWAQPFNAANTSLQIFYVRDAKQTQVQMMTHKRPYRYFEDDRIQAIELPYRDGRLAMSVILPRSRNGMDALEQRLDAGQLSDWLSQLDHSQPRAVYLHLPKLQTEASYQLIPALRAMGMGVAFTDRADFRGIADANLKIGQVVHKTFLRIDEKGTEAAAATAVEVEVTSAPSVPPPTLRADHPFLFILRDRPTGAILFMGRIEAPAAS